MLGNASFVTILMVGRAEDRKAGMSASDVPEPDTAERLQPAGPGGGQDGGPDADAGRQHGGGHQNYRRQAVRHEENLISRKCAFDFRSIFHTQTFSISRFWLLLFII